MTAESVRQHIAILLSVPEAQVVDRLRRRWDPAMAQVVPPHVTLCYPEEFGRDSGLLLRRVLHAVQTVGSFRLRSGRVTTAEGGVFLDVEDVDGGWAALRQRILAPPLLRADVAPHITIAHPRTSRSVRSCAADLFGRQVRAEYVVRELALTAATPTRFAVLRRFRLMS